MSWQEILGHESVLERFRRGVSRGRLASSFLFVGPAGVGKFRFARQLAAALLCDTNQEQVLEPCGHCPVCQQVRSESHPDLEVVRKPLDKNFIPLETFIGDKEHRMREGLCHRISLMPFCGGRKIVIINDADYLNMESANCLLKTLEEPPPRSVLILIGTSEHKQLPTIRSRCQVIRFSPLPVAVVERLLVERKLIEDKDQARELAHLSEGSLERALEYADLDLRDFRSQLFSFLAQPHPDSVGFSRSLTAFIDDAGKDAPPKRRRMRQVILSGAEFYRALMRGMSSAATADQQGVLRETVQQALEKWPGDERQAAQKLDRCLLAIDQLQANANVSTLLECWVDDLAR